jgi:hypothetical protein
MCAGVNVGCSLALFKAVLFFELVLMSALAARVYMFQLS